jgi:hypothetical protein
LKIAADHFPDTRILATGSSTLGAPTIVSEESFGVVDDAAHTRQLAVEMFDIA